MGEFLRRVYYLGLRWIRNIRTDGKFIETVHYGSEYGGFNVYISDVKKENGGVVLSFGIGEDISFDESIINDLQYEVYAYDPTPKSLSWLKSLNLNDKFHYYPYGLGVKDGKEKFYIPTNPKHVSGSILSAEHLHGGEIDVDMKSLSTIIKDLNINHIDILKMDIEGSEFSVVPSIFNENLSIDQICIEIHHRFMKKRNGGQAYSFIMNSPFNIHLIKLIRKIKREGYFLAHISENDEEYTFVSKDFLMNAKKRD